MKLQESRDYFDLQCVVNGEAIRQRIPTHMRLLDFLRDELRLTGAKEVCGEGECGACTVMVDEKTVNSCLILAVEVHGSEIRTVEDLASENDLSDIQQAFIEKHAVQCGYCIPGMILSGEWIHSGQQHADREFVAEELAGNICRCTGYKKIIDAVENT